MQEMSFILSWRKKHCVLYMAETKSYVSKMRKNHHLLANFEMEEIFAVPKSCIFTSLMEDINSLVLNRMLKYTATLIAF